MLLQKKEEEDKDSEDSETDSPALTGSLSSLYGGFNPYLYNQFNLHIREQKINQITLLKVTVSSLVLLNSIKHITLEFNITYGCSHRMLSTK